MLAITTNFGMGRHSVLFVRRLPFASMFSIPILCPSFSLLTVHKSTKSVLHDGNPVKRLWVGGQVRFPNANEIGAPTCLWARIELLPVGILIIWIV